MNSELKKDNIETLINNRIKILFIEEYTLNALQRKKINIDSLFSNTNDMFRSTTDVNIEEKELFNKVSKIDIQRMFLVNFGMIEDMLKNNLTSIANFDYNEFCYIAKAYKDTPKKFLTDTNNLFKAMYEKKNTDDLKYISMNTDISEYFYFTKSSNGVFVVLKDGFFDLYTPSVMDKENQKLIFKTLIDYLFKHYSEQEVSLSPYLTYYLTL